MASNELATTEAPPPDFDSETRKLQLRIGTTIRRTFVVLFGVTVLCVGYLGYIITVGMGSENPTAAMAFAASVQVGYGMTMGFACVFIGLMMTWFGVQAAYSVKASAEVGSAKGDMALKSASPGLLFAFGGMVLIAVSLYKPIIYEERGGFPSAMFGKEQSDAPALPPTDADDQQ